MIVPTGVWKTENGWRDCDSLNEERILTLVRVYGTGGYPFKAQMRVFF